MPEAQNLKNHARFDPPYHFFIALVLLANIIVSIVGAVHAWPHHPFMAVWRVVVAIALFLLAFKARSYPLAAQDRVIRLEERLRFQALLPPEDLARTHSLSLQQIVALRFVSDEELPGVVHRTLTENLTPKQIKETIKDWRADYTRV
jgi:Family of unknown function (DUF6526)